MGRSGSPWALVTVLALAYYLVLTRLGPRLVPPRPAGGHQTGLAAGVVLLVGAVAQLLRLVPPPGAAGPEAFDAVGLAIQSLQIVVIVAAVAAQRRTPVAPP